MRNPKWPPHAKFHNGQTIALGFGLGIMMFVVLYGMPFFDRGVLLLAAALASLYWVCLLAAAIFPETGWTDREFEAITPKPFGMHIQQVISPMVSTQTPSREHGRVCRFGASLSHQWRQFAHRRRRCPDIVCEALSLRALKRYAFQ